MMKNPNFTIKQQDDVIVFPCSATQKQFWLVSHLMAKNPAYNIPLGFIADASLNVDALQQAVAQLVERHEVLRMTFHWVDGELEQHLAEDYTFSIARESIPAGTDLRAFAQQLCEMKFELAEHPGFVARCFSLGDGRYFVFFCFHHIIVDHRAVLTFEEEFKSVYVALAAGREPALDEVAVQFGDFVLWRNENYPPENLEPVYQFWVKHLQGQTGKLNLPLDARRTADLVGRGKELQFAFSDNVSAAIVDFARKKAMSHFVVGLTALKVLLFRYSRQSDIVVGSPFTERGLLEELESVMGCFMNMLPLPSWIEGTESFSTLLTRQAGDFLSAIDHLTVSLDEIISRLNLVREPGLNPLFQVGFTFQEAPAALSIPGLAIESMPLHSGGAMYDLHFWLWEKDGQIAGSVWYASELLNESSVRQLVADFERVFGQLVSQPDVAVDDVIQCVRFDFAATDVPVVTDQLSPSQQFYWLAEQFAHLGAQQNLCSAWWLPAQTDLAELSSRIPGLYKQNPQLGLRLKMGEDVGLPQVMFTLPDALPLQQMTAESRADAQQQLQTVHATSFDLLAGDLIRFVMIAVPGEGALIGVVAHNLLLDETSLYRISLDWAGVTVEVPVPAGRNPSHPGSRDAFWRRHVQRDWGVLELTADYARPPVFDGKGGHVLRTLPAELAERVATFAQRASVNPETLWLTLITIALYRHTRQNEMGIAVSLPQQGSGEAGCYSDLLPFLADVDGSLSLNQCLQKAARQLNRLLEHRGTSYQAIMSYVHGEKDRSRTPLTQCFAGIRQHAQRVTSADFGTIDRVHCGSVGARTDISFIVELDATAVHLELEYASSIYRRESVEQLAHRFEALIDFVLREPDMPIDKAPLLTGKDTEILASATSGPVHELPALDLVTLFRASAENHALRVAVTDQQRTLTYQQLWQDAGHVASQLIAAGMGGRIIAIYMDRTVDMVVALLGVLRAGATYLPLDPDNPLDRIRIVLEDSGAAYCISDERYIDAFSSLNAGASVVRVQDLVSAGDGASADGVSVAPEHMAYVIFTSGSTGRPKGVMVQHEAVVNFLTSMAREPGLNSDDRILATTTISFDIAVLEIMLPLVTGAQIVLASRQQAMDGMQLQQLIEAHSITCLQATPTSWRILMASGWEGQQNLKALVGGEALTDDLRDQLTGKVFQLWNMYGPTETTVWSTCKLVQRDTPANCIGTPIDNTTVLVLDEAMQRQPVNVPGELCIGGVGVTLGYYGRQDLTDDRFVTLPSGERVYRTGDLVHLGWDGNLYYHRRMDDQVKIRGYRIELGEIEARIRDQAGIKNAAVIVAGKTPLDQKLVAFVQPGPGEQLAAESLRASLADVLPGYMIPQIIVEIHELPRTSSGKVDKKMLATLPMKEKAEETLFLDAALSKLLTEQAEIREAVVVINKRTQERTCHYQVAEDAYVTVGALRKLTRQAITDDMPLRQFIEVQDWPRHTDGGIDWKALHEEDKSADQPRTETEKALHRIWVDVIGNDAIRRTDNFFDVGGHSLLAVQVIMRIRKELGAEISQDRLLLGNLETLAAECDAQRQPGAAENAVEASSEVASSSDVAEKSEPQPATEPTAEKASKGLFSKLFRR